ncbi:MAG: family 10 glycosylhydrolase [Gemmatimonadaceae bacterium]
MRSRILVRRTNAIIAAALLAACKNPTAPNIDAFSGPPPIAREMRGLWLTTVNNTDWPSRNSLTPDQQRAELIDILDRAAATGFNAIIFQVRPAADAVYSSSIEPWAAMLTGTQGVDPGYDPLALAITEAHARGMELHAWINPFRAGNSKDTAKLAPTHAFNTRRDLIRIYGSQVWFDPGEPEVQDRSIQVVSDIVRRYDIDAIHADDYFYPYQEHDAAGRLIDFPDSASYARSGSSLSRDDWRRENINRFVERMNREVHQIKPAIKVGLSPFGIWRPGNPPTVTGLDAFATIYADSRKWLQQGWVDYLVPQLYWSIASPGQSYPALLDWWLSQDTMPRHVWPGLAAYRVADGGPTAFGLDEIANQIKLTRARPGGTGHVLFNTVSTLKRASSGPVAVSLVPLYSQRAILPASPWLDSIPPAAPAIGVSGRGVQIIPAAGEAARWWYVRSRGANGWKSQVVFATQQRLVLDVDPDWILVNAVDQAGNASAAAEWKR